jgi:hypothetical protein
VSDEAVKSMTLEVMLSESEYFLNDTEKSKQIVAANAHN